MKFLFVFILLLSLPTWAFPKEAMEVLFIAFKDLGGPAKDMFWVTYTVTSAVAARAVTRDGTTGGMTRRGINRQIKDAGGDARGHKHKAK